MRRLLILILLLFTFNGFSQQAVFDSLYQEAINAKTDYYKSYYFDEACRAILRYNPDSALVVAQLGLRYAKKTENDTLIADSYNSLGTIYKTISDYQKAISNSKNAIKHASKVNALLQLKNANSALGLIYTQQGNFSAAIEIYYQLLLDARKREDTSSIAHISNNLGNIYFEQNLYDKALENYKEAYEYALIMGSEFGQCLLLGNMGAVYYKKKQYDLAMENYQKSYEISVRIEDFEGIGIMYGSFASVYFDQGDYDKALEYQIKALEMKQQLNDRYGESVSLNELGKIYHEIGDINKGVFYGKGALNIAKEIGAKELERDANEALYKMFEDKGDKTNAYLYFRNHIELRDSLINEETKKKDIRNELNFQFQKQHFADSLEQVKKDEIAQQTIEKERVKANAQKKLTYVFIAAFVLMLILSGLIFKEYKAKKRSNEIIKQQKQEVEEQSNIISEKNKEILDSITYAKRIQNAILPPDKLVKEYLENSFILYIPKDIVAGDFYWMEHKDDKVLFAAADCTGHGVPGAMVSVVCNNGLNRAVREHGLTDPGKILDKTREIVVKEFEKSEEEVKDGMDIALCSLKYKVESEKLSNTQNSSPKTVATLQYAGAHNPLWIIRNNAEEIEEIKADKQPIGKTDNPQSYSTHKVMLNQGDTIYIFSDGYADQFGGEKGKKMKTANFKKLLLSIQNENMQKQRELINRAFEDWKGDIEQLDDVCVIGVRI